ncbi:hypothetical protein G6F45_010701 [Rhizopus arrhizus]|nr:hypothetical protein G6F45_010701 [Rhizopus arrhizus]
MSLQIVYQTDKINRKRLNILAVPSSTELLKDCPSPFVKDTLASIGDGQTTDKTFCLAGCCAPCPLQNFIYKKGWAEKGFNVSNALRFVSAILSFFLVVSYLVLPDKRRHPSLLILNLSIGIFLFSMTSFFAIGNLKRVQCSSNGISPGEMDNNKLCAAQGAILVFGSFATAFWCSALILNLHLHTVWNYGFFTNRYVLLNTICWGIPTAITCIAIGLHAIKFEIASLCLVSMEYIFKLFFYPLAAIIIPSFLVHIATFFYIAHIAIREGLQSDMTQSLSAAAGNHPDRQPAVNHRHIMAAVQIQWRALMLAVAAIVTVLFYWLAYMTQMSRITQILDNASFTATWVHCMITPEMDQDTCYELVKSSLPSFPLMLSADILAGLIGFWLFILFAKRSLWREWNDLIYDIRLTLTGSNFKKNREQFFTL